MIRIVYFAGRVVGLLVQPFVDGVLDGAFGMPDQDDNAPNPHPIPDPVPPLDWSWMEAA